MLFTYAIGALVGGLVRLIDTKGIKYLAIGYFFISLPVHLLLNGNDELLPVIIVLAIKSLLVYGWAHLLYRLQDAIFGYLIILVIGAFLLGRF